MQPPSTERSAEPSFLGLISAIPDFGLAVTFLLTWMDPARTGGAPMVANLLLVILMEFITIHASGVLGSVIFSDAGSPQRVRKLLGMGLFYAVFVLSFVAMFKQWWPAWSFALLLGNRLLTVILDRQPDEAQKRRIQGGWALSVLFFLVFVALTTFIPLPALGIASVHMPPQLQPGGGVWNNEPWRLLAFGVLYFAAQGIAEVVGALYRPSRTNATAGQH
ncbi:MAG TPA: hypothetical protein VGM23_06495 [Armatimonadota bacterium]